SLSTQRRPEVCAGAARVLECKTRTASGGRPPAKDRPRVEGGTDGEGYQGRHSRAMQGVADAVAGRPGTSSNEPRATCEGIFIGPRRCPSDGLGAPSSSRRQQDGATAHVRGAETYRPTQAARGRMRWDP